jgi:EpsI family protein
VAALMAAAAPAVPDYRVSISSWAPAAWMAACLGIATWLTPHATWYERLGSPEYAALVPASFGDWVDTEESDAGLVSPAQGEALRTIYSQIVSRTYLHRPTGRRLMLSLAYGQVQKGATQLHRPESCYSSQGFTIRNLAPDGIPLGAGSVGVFRMTGVIGARNEQVTYWIRMGDRILDGQPYQLNMTRMAMGLKGMVADGLLFRVSELTPDVTSAERLEDQFVRDLLAAVPPASQAAFIGKPVASIHNPNP